MLNGGKFSLMNDSTRNRLKVFPISTHSPYSLKLQYYRFHVQVSHSLGAMCLSAGCDLVIPFESKLFLFNQAPNVLLKLIMFKKTV